MKMSINLPDELVKLVDGYAAEKFVNRTSAICVLLSNALQSNDIQKSMASIKDVSAALNRLDADTQKADS